ncbi:hypothetical protein CBL_06315 [Carabus blaptoides fortunei]
MIITVVFLIFVCISISNSNPIYYEDITDMEPTDLDTSFRFVFAPPEFNTTIIESEDNGENAVDIETKYNETEIIFKTYK